MKIIYPLDKFLEENKVFEGRFRACKGYIYVGNNVKIGEEYGGYKEGYICAEEIIWKKDGTLELRRYKLRKRSLEIVEEIRPLWLWGLRIDDIYLKDIDEDIHIKVSRFQYKKLLRFIIANIKDNKYIIIDNRYTIKEKKYIEIDIKKGTYTVVTVNKTEYMSKYPRLIGKIILHEELGWYNPSYHLNLAILFNYYVDYLFSLKEKSGKDIAGL